MADPNTRRQALLVDLDGRPMPVDPSMIIGATVPPSREDQTAYTTVATAVKTVYSTAVVDDSGTSTVYKTITLRPTNTAYNTVLFEVDVTAVAMEETTEI